MSDDSRPIDRFVGIFSYLSNFSKVPTVYLGELYPTVENAYQAAKCLDVNTRRVFFYLTPGQAKREGRHVPLRPDWDEVKLGIMEDLIHQKFKLDPLRSELLKTHPQQLIEGNYWHDNFWGCCTCGACHNGQNHLGKIIMRVREGMYSVR